MGNLHRSVFSRNIKAHISGEYFCKSTQFNDIDDFKNYPRTIERDIEILGKQNVDILYMPCKKFY